MDVKRYEDDDALSVLHANASKWEWVITGYSRDTDIVIIEGAEGDRFFPTIGLGRYLLCRHPEYLFYGSMHSRGSGYLVCNPTEVEKLYASLQLGPLNSTTNILAFSPSPGELTALLRCRSLTLLLQGGAA